MLKAFDFEMEMQVRDYECDIQGIVNNSVYQNYLEHCRHKFLNTVDLDFATMHNDGIDAVVIRAELEYKSSLKPGDDFLVRLKMGRKGNLRLIFDQEILRKSDMKVAIEARIFTALIRNGRPVSPDLLMDKFTSAGITLEEVK